MPNFSKKDWTSRTEGTIMDAWKGGKNMVKLIPRCPEFTAGYREYCQEMFDNHVTYFIPTNPTTIDEKNTASRTLCKQFCGELLDSILSVDIGSHYRRSYA